MGDVPVDAQRVVAATKEAVRLGDYAAASSLVQGLLKSHPSSFDARFLAGVIAARQDRVAEALAEFSVAIEMQPRSEETLSWLCLLHRRNGEAAIGLDFGLRLLEINPKHVDGLVNVGLCYLELCRFDAALTSFERAISVNPNHPIAHHNRGIALQRSGRLKEAIQEFSKAISLAPSVPASYLSLGKLLEQLGKPAEAHAAFDFANRAAGTDLQSRLALGSGLLREGLIERAVNSLVETVREHSSASRARQLLGEGFRFLGRFS